MVTVVQQRDSTVGLTLDWAGLHFLIDPANVVGDTGVHTGFVPLPAPIAPADHTHQSHTVVVLADKRTTRVSLQKKNQIYIRELEYYFFAKIPWSGGVRPFLLCRRRRGLECHLHTACWTWPGVLTAHQEHIAR